MHGIRVNLNYLCLKTENHNLLEDCHSITQKQLNRFIENKPNWFSQIGINLVYCLTACLYEKCPDRSGPFIRFLIKVKTQDFWEDDRETINRSHERLVTFGQLLVNFRKLSEKT